MYSLSLCLTVAVLSATGLADDKASCGALMFGSLARTVPIHPPESNPEPMPLQPPGQGGGGIESDPQATPGVEPTPQPPCGHNCPQLNYGGCVTCDDGRQYCLLVRNPVTGYWAVSPNCEGRNCWKCIRYDRQDPQCCLYWEWTCEASDPPSWGSVPTHQVADCSPDPTPTPTATPLPSPSSTLMPPTPSPSASPSPTPTPCPEGTLPSATGGCECLMPPTQPVAGAGNCTSEHSINPILGCTIVTRWCCLLQTTAGTQGTRHKYEWNPNANPPGWDYSTESCASVGTE